MRENSAVMILRAWKRYRMLAMIPKVMKERKKRAITEIQKFIRGFNEFFKYKQLLRQFRLENNFKYFNEIREKILVDCQIKIRYYWRRYKRRQLSKSLKLTKKQTEITNNKYQPYKARPNARGSIYQKASVPKQKQSKKGKDGSYKNPSVESPTIYNSDLKLENRVENNKYQTSKFIHKQMKVHFQDHQSKLQF